MSSWVIQLFEKSGRTALIELMDIAGPFNKWRSRDPEAFTPNSGYFINQLSRVMPTEEPSWYLEGLDIDEVDVGISGWGEVLVNHGWFPAVEVEWKVISPLQHGEPDESGPVVTSTSARGDLPEK